MLQPFVKLLSFLCSFGIPESLNRSKSADPVSQRVDLSAPLKPASSASVAIGGVLQLLDEMADLLGQTGDFMQIAVQQVSRDFSSIAATSRSAVAASRRGLDEYRDHDQILRTIHESLCAISQVA